MGRTETRTTTCAQSLRGEYRRREPEKTLLHQIVRTHWEEFLELTRQLAHGSGLPRFVTREFEAYLRCGILEHGFVRVHCSSCQKDALVAFSCKGRAFCPSCGGRRMAGFAAHLVDRVLPRVPVRQWVFTVPIPLRLLLAFDPSLLARVRGVFVRAVHGWIRRRSRLQGLLDPQTGSVTVVQRFGSALNLNVHFHALFLDGSFYSARSGRMQFCALPSPSDEDLAVLLANIRSRILALLRRRGLDLEALGQDSSPLPLDSPTLAACLAASAQSKVALGPSSGQPLPRRREDARRHPLRFPKPGCVLARGFSLHADLRVRARDRDILETVCRYLLRPPLSSDRLSPTEDGRIALKLKTHYDDGTTHVLLTPQVLLERLAALVPPPRKHQVVYHGLLASAAAFRPEIVPAPTTASDSQATSPATSTGLDPAAPQATKPRNYDWARLMRRVFAVDVLQCPCGARRSVIATITQPEVIQAILRCTGLAERYATGPPTVPNDSRARATSQPCQKEVRFVPDEITEPATE